MKAEKAVLKETLFIASGTLILSVLMQAVFLMAGKWSASVLFGNLLTAIPSVFNFFAMGLTVKEAVKKSEKNAKNMMKLSMLARTFLIFVFVLIGVLTPEKFNLISVLLPLFFPRITILFRPLFKMEDAGQVAFADEETEKEEQ